MFGSHTHHWPSAAISHPSNCMVQHPTILVSATFHGYPPSRHPTIPDCHELHPITQKRKNAVGASARDRRQIVAREFTWLSSTDPARHNAPIVQCGCKEPWVLWVICLSFETLRHGGRQNFVSAERFTKPLTGEVVSVREVLQRICGRCGTRAQVLFPASATTWSKIRTIGLGHPQHSISSL